MYQKLKIKTSVAIKLLHNTVSRNYIFQAWGDADAECRFFVPSRVVPLSGSLLKHLTSPGGRLVRLAGNKQPASQPGSPRYT